MRSETGLGRFRVIAPLFWVLVPQIKRYWELLLFMILNGYIGSILLIEVDFELFTYNWKHLKCDYVI